MVHSETFFLQMECKIHSHFFPLGSVATITMTGENIFKTLSYQHKVFLKNAKIKMDK